MYSHVHYIVFTCTLYWVTFQNIKRQGKSEGFDSFDRPGNLTQIWPKSSIFQLVCPWNLMDALKNNRAPLLCHITQLCASFQIHQWIQITVTVRKRSIWVKLGDFLSCVTLKFDGWPWKTIEHLFYVGSSFVHHVIAISEFKKEIYASFVPCDLEIWQMTFKNNRVPLLCYFKFCASFRSHWWIQTGVTVGKRPIWVKIDSFFSRATLKFDRWPWKTIGHLS